MEFNTFVNAFIMVFGLFEFFGILGGIGFLFYFFSRLLPDRRRNPPSRSGAKLAPTSVYALTSWRDVCPTTLVPTGKKKGRIKSVPLPQASRQTFDIVYLHNFFVLMSFRSNQQQLAQLLRLNTISVPFLSLRGAIWLRKLYHSFLQVQ